MDMDPVKITDVDIFGLGLGNSIEREEQMEEFVPVPGYPEPIFVNVYGAQESIPRNKCTITLFLLGS
jgi:hypothetical protein